MTVKNNFSETILEWWRENIANRESGRARALAARLRRAGVIETLAEPEVHILAQRLGLGRSERDAAQIVRLVQALAEVRENDPQRLARRLGGPEPAMSSLRFQRLLRSRGEELTTALRRALPMVDRRCNVAQLGRDLLNWDDERCGDRTRAEWCFEYFGVLPPGREVDVEAPCKETTA
jgi:CRISPR system Cascade subunit CasB